MKKPKDFDCVEMKDRIQQEILKDFEGLSNEEFRKAMMSEVQNDPVFGPLWERLPEVRPK